MLRPSPAAVPTRDKGAMRSPAAGRLTLQAVRGVVTTSLQPEERSVEGEKGSPIVGIENTPLAFVVVLETFCPVHWNTIPALGKGGTAVALLVETVPVTEHMRRP